MRSEILQLSNLDHIFLFALLLFCSFVVINTYTMYGILCMVYYVWYTVCLCIDVSMCGDRREVVCGLSLYIILDWLD